MTRTGRIIVWLVALVLLTAVIFTIRLATAPAPVPSPGNPIGPAAARSEETANGPQAQPAPADTRAVEAQAGPLMVPGMPEHVGECAMTRVEWVGTRLEADGTPVPDSGSAIRLENGVYGVSYEQVPAVDSSRVGDRVRTCLVGIPSDCPPGDDRGREYRTFNQRTGQDWTLPDAQHMCGGA